MCGRFVIASEREVLEQRFQARVDAWFEKHYNAYPNHDAYQLPLITEEDPEKIALRYWGIVPKWWKRDKRGLINIKYETLRDKKTFAKDLAERRCLVLADGFYEWKGERGKKVPYYFRLRDAEPFAFAGVYEDNDIDGETIGTFSIITTEPNALMKPVHNRMPVMLRREVEREWMNPYTSPEMALELLTETIPAEAMKMYEVSKKVNRPTFDAPDLVEHV